METAERRARALVVVALAGWAAPWFGSALGGGSLLYFRDLLQNLYPWRRFWAEEAARGRWPLWDPYAASGTPYLANPNTLSLYPLSWLQALLPFDLAFNWTILLTWLLAQCGAYRLGRHLGLGRAAALLGALALGGSGYLVSALNLPNLLLASAAAPWIAWAGLRVARRAAARDAALLAGAIALGVLGGEPFTLVLSLAACALLLCLRERRQGAPASRRWKAALAAVGIAALLSAPLLLPAAELAALSERGGGLSQNERTRWSAGGLELAGLVLPRLGGDPTSFDPGRFWSQARHHGEMPLLVSLYAGTPLLALAAFGWGGLGRAPRLLLGAGIGLCVALAAGPELPLHAALEAVAPPARWVRYPVKFLLGTFALLSLLAGFGLERLWRGEGPGRLARGWPLALAAGLAVALAVETLAGGWIEAAARAAFALPAELARASVPGLRRSLAVGLALSAAAGLLLGPLRTRLRPHAACAIWIILVAGDLWAAQCMLVPRAPAALFRLQPLFAGHLRAGDRLYREERPEGFRLRAPGAARMWGFLWDRATLARATASEARIHNLLERPTDRLWPATTARLGRWAAEADPETRARLLRRLGAGWWQTHHPGAIAGTQEVAVARGVCEPPLRLLRVLRPLPPVFWTARFALADDEASLRRGLTGPEEGIDVWVEVLPGASPPSPAGEAPGKPAGDSPSGVCRLVSRTTDRIELRCEAEASGLAVVLDAWYPGWEARVDGARMAALRANAAYRAVELSPGRHSVVWRFRPFSLQAGRALGLLGLALLAVAASRQPPLTTKSVTLA